MTNEPVLPTTADITWPIRPATEADIPTVAEFNRRLAAETENKTLDLDVLTRGVTKLLADPRKGRYFVAEHEGAIIGQIMHTYEWSDWRDGDIWWIQSVYVAEPFRRRGVFRALLQTLLAEAEHDPGVVGLRLYVERNNDPAKRTYASLGFVGDEYEVMERLG